MMLIWGTSPTKRKLGYVADKCLPSGKVSKIEVYRIGQTGHFFWIPIGKGQFIESYGICELCNSKIELEISDYVQIHKDKYASARELVPITNPRLLDKSGKLSEEFLRFSSIREPFLKFGQYLNINANAETKFDKTSVLAFLVTFSVPIGLWYLFSKLPIAPQIELYIFKGLFGLFCMGFITSLFLFIRYPYRVIKKETLPKIVKELEPQNPTQEEIENVLKKIGSYGHRVPKYFSAKSIMKALKKITKVRIKMMNFKHINSIFYLSPWLSEKLRA